MAMMTGLNTGISSIDEQQHHLDDARTTIELSGLPSSQQQQQQQQQQQHEEQHHHHLHSSPPRPPRSSPTSPSRHHSSSPRSPITPVLSDSSSWASQVASASSWVIKTTATDIHDKIMLTSANHSVIHWHHENEDAIHHVSPPSKAFPQVLMDEPHLARVRELLAVLFLTSILVFLSAMDAKNHCISLEAYAVYDMLDDDINNNIDMEDMDEEDLVAEQSQICVQMFRLVIVPVCATTFAMGIVSLLLIHRHVVNNISNRATQQPKFFDEDPATKLERQQSNVRLCLRLLIATGVVSLTWTYGTTAIMLRPRMDNSNNNNPYQSLAAVDLLGHVGDNANLYYTSWLSFVLSVALVYQTCVDSLHQCRMVRLARHHLSTRQMSPPHHVGDVEAMLSTKFSTQQIESFRATRATWYNSIYKLRTRTGIWMAILLTALVIMGCSVHIWKFILYPTAMSIFGQDDDYNKRQQLDEPNFIQICEMLQINGPQLGVPAEMCVRTIFAFLSGVMGSVLSLGAIVLHLLARQDAARTVDEEETCVPVLVMQQYSNHFVRKSNKHLPLLFEFILSVIISVLLGLNAVFATAVQGPAATVGNLYYSSWISFMLCLRVCLGCLEELYRIEDEEESREKTSKKKRVTHQLAQQELKQNGLHHADSLVKEKTSHATSDGGIDQYVAPSFEETEQPKDAITKPRHQLPVATVYMHKGGAKQESFSSNDILETQRAKRLRHYFFLWIFSTVCTASALDSAENTASVLTVPQKYMIYGPAIVAIMSACQFLLCLDAETYLVVSNFYIGGVLSIVAFCLWLANLILTMHDENSWAVNAIGDIKMANLYYFSWASILTAGLQMVSYIEAKLGVHPKDLMIVVWMAVNKICFVVVGAGMHIWHNIQDNCGIAELQTGAVTFCSRTVFAIGVGLTGMAVGSTIVASRLCESLLPPLPAGASWWRPCSTTRHVRPYVEATVSVFLVLLFGVAVATITGIGGPGQSVGDLYYAIWLAFVVSIAAVVNCYDQIKLDEMERTTTETCYSDDHSSRTQTVNSEIPFVQMG